MILWNSRILYELKNSLRICEDVPEFGESERERERVKKHPPHSADSFGDFVGTARSMRSFFSNMSRISISSHSGGISILFFSAIDLLLDVRFVCDYPAPVPRAHNQYQSRGGHRREVSLSEPLQACSPPRNPHLDQCRHVKTYETEQRSKLFRSH